MRRGGLAMKKIGLLLIVLIAAVRFGDSSRVQAAEAPDSKLKVILLGTGSGPAVDVVRYGISTLVVAGSEKLLFDCGRAASMRITQLGMRTSDINKVFLTHLHSDHIVGVPDLYLTGWIPNRVTPFRIWGPDGTRAMMDNLQKAFAVDIHIRRDVDEKFSAEGIKVVATDIRQGVVYDTEGVKVTAFLVDHGPVKPAFGYRVDYNGHSVVMSGDTEPSDNVVTFAQGVDVLVHEVAGGLRDDSILQGPPNEVLPNGATRAQARAARAHHTDPIEAGQIFARVKPKLAVFSHGGTQATLPYVRQNYSGPVEVGEDMMTIDIGETVEVHRFKQ